MCSGLCGPFTVKYVMYDCFLFFLIFFSLDINECKSTPCLNDGLCVDGINSYRCKCKENYVGENCETSKYIMFQAMTL